MEMIPQQRMLIWLILKRIENISQSHTQDLVLILITENTPRSFGGSVIAYRAENETAHTRGFKLT